MRKLTICNAAVNNVYFLGAYMKIVNVDDFNLNCSFLNEINHK